MGCVATNAPSLTGGALAIWGRATAFDASSPYVADALLAAALAGGSALWAAVHTGGEPPVWVFSAAMALPLVGRRLWPEATFVCLSAIALAQWVTTVALPADASLLAALFTLALERPRRTALVAAGILETGVVMASTRWALGDSWEASLVGLSGLVAAALLAGAVFKARRDHIAALTDRAARLEIERDQQAQLAAAAERARIAREMHDVIAHSLAVMVTMADGAAAKLRRELSSSAAGGTSNGPSSAREAVEAIAEVGRQALGDTRRLVGVLRHDEVVGERLPAPGLPELEELIVGLRATGLDASIELVGEPFELAPGAALTVYRLVQEAATNTLKHAAGARVFVVRVLFERPGVRVEVLDDGTASVAAETGHGHGLAGMRERAALYGGTVEAGPAPGGGWSVKASLASGGLPAQLVRG